MKKLLLAALLCSSQAFAANTAVLTWTPPANLSDGNPIPAGSLSIGVYQGLHGATKPKIDTVTGTTTTISNGLASGKTYCWAVTSIVTGIPESVQSTEACKTFPAASVSAPSGLDAK